MIKLSAAIALLLSSSMAWTANNVPVPAQCTPQVNTKLADMIASGTRQDIDNIMACGVATEKTRTQKAGPHGSHHMTTVAVQLPGGQKANIQVVTNDALDGIVTAKPGDSIFAYGQGYITHGAWVAGIHDTHCSTHRGADNGWIVVNGVKTPSTCTSDSPRRRRL